MQPANSITNRQRAESSQYDAVYEKYVDVALDRIASQPPSNPAHIAPVPLPLGCSYDVPAARSLVRALRNGKVDRVVVFGSNDSRVQSLQRAFEDEIRRHGMPGRGMAVLRAKDRSCAYSSEISGTHAFFDHLCRCRTDPSTLGKALRDIEEAVGNDKELRRAMTMKHPEVGLGRTCKHFVNYLISDNMLSARARAQAVAAAAGRVGVGGAVTREDLRYTRSVMGAVKLSARASEVVPPSVLDICDEKASEQAVREFLLALPPHALADNGALLADVVGYIKQPSGGACQFFTARDLCFESSLVITDIEFALSPNPMTRQMMQRLLPANERCVVVYDGAQLALAAADSWTLAVTISDIMGAQVRLDELLRSHQRSAAKYPSPDEEKTAALAAAAARCGGSGSGQSFEYSQAADWVAGARAEVVSTIEKMNKLAPKMEQKLQGKAEIFRLNPRVVDARCHDLWTAAYEVPDHLPPVPHLSTSPLTIPPFLLPPELAVTDTVLDMAGKLLHVAQSFTLNQLYFDPRTHDRARAPPAAAWPEHSVAWADRHLASTHPLKIMDGLLELFIRECKAWGIYVPALLTLPARMEQILTRSERPTYVFAQLRTVLLFGARCAAAYLWERSWDTKGTGQSKNAGHSKNFVLYRSSTQVPPEPRAPPSAPSSICSLTITCSLACAHNMLVSSVGASTLVFGAPLPGGRVPSKQDELFAHRPIPNLCAVPIGVGDDQAPIELPETFTTSKPHVEAALVQSYGNLLMDLIESIPGSLMVVFPSYSMLERFIVGWELSGHLSAASLFKTPVIVPVAEVGTGGAGVARAAHAYVEDEQMMENLKDDAYYVAGYNIWAHAPAYLRPRERPKEFVKAMELFADMGRGNVIFASADSVVLTNGMFCGQVHGLLMVGRPRDELILRPLYACIGGASDAYTAVMFADGKYTRPEFLETMPPWFRFDEAAADLQSQLQPARAALGLVRNFVIKKGHEMNIDK